MLQRKTQPMPEYVMQALRRRGLVNDYKNRPEYQKNDYLSWISRAKQVETKEKRLNQMLDELEAGGIYMNMKHNASRK